MLRLPASEYGFVEQVAWIPSAGISYHLGVDGLSLPLVAITVVVFTAAAVYSLREDRRPKSYVLLFLALQTVSVGVFVALDLILFFDLSIVFMYFVIAGWGHGSKARSATLTFFLYTFLGSLALLLGFILIYLAATPHTFDIPALAAQNPLAAGGPIAGAALLAIGIGLAVKTPLVPFHTWLPPAHTEAPAAGSAVLAGVLLKTAPTTRAPTTAWRHAPRASSACSPWPPSPHSCSPASPGSSPSSRSGVDRGLLHQPIPQLGQRGARVVEHDGTTPTRIHPDVDDARLPLQQPGRLIRVRAPWDASEVERHLTRRAGRRPRPA
ncbi:complex I subunit 4 family protein [Actinomycetospora lemnae]|uniref:complex I subunit 4 family protein n=1 Tax=Actinomycetospora lemnae TaxID=3019891 RepID=UPI002FCD4BF7